MARIEREMEISIIIPVYNKIKYIGVLLDMVIGQSFTDFECLLIDDGSTDGSGGVCDAFAERDDRFRVFHIDNGGVSHARNFGLRQAKGKYLTFIDGDDGIHRDYLQNLYTCLVDHNVDMVISGFLQTWDASDSSKEFRYPLNGTYEMRELLPKFACLQKTFGVFGWCCAKLFPASLAVGIYFDESLRLAEDFDFYVRLYPAVQRIYFDDKCFYYYRQAAENSSMLLPDDAIDYFAQLRINLRYKSFLERMDAYSGENRQIVNDLICNYIYLTLFHSPVPMFYERFNAVYSLYQRTYVRLYGNGFLKKWFLWTVRHKARHLAKLTLVGYRLIRKVKRDFSHHTSL